MSGSQSYEYFSLPVPPPDDAVDTLAPDEVGPQPTQLTFDGQPKGEADWGALEGVLAGTETVTVTNRRHGTVVTRADKTKINCGVDCTATYERGARVVLTAKPADGYVFSAWTGACAGEDARCIVRTKHSKSVGATFTQGP